MLVWRQVNAMPLCSIGGDDFTGVIPIETLKSWGSSSKRSTSNYLLPMYTEIVKILNMSGVQSMEVDFEKDIAYRGCKF